MVKNIIEYRLEQCPICNLSHIYNIEILYESQVRLQKELILFGGKSTNLEEIRKDVMLKCKKNNTAFPYTISFSYPQAVEIIAVTPIDYKDIGSTNSRTSEEKHESQPYEDDDLSSELVKEWLKSSHEKVTDYCKTMMTISLGAIPIFFTVLEYIDYQPSNDLLTASMGIIVPSLFLLSVVIFILTIRPQYLVLSSNKEFEEYRKQRFKRMNRFIIFGTFIFLSAIVIAIVTAFEALTR